MNPITYYIKQALADYYPDSEAASLAKLLLEVFRNMSRNNWMIF